MAQMAPDIYNLPELHRGMLNVLGIKNAEKLVPIEDDQKPTDPVQENQNALKGTPLKAFLHQDHASHIQVHMMLLQDPQIQQFIGQNPQAPKIMGAITAHIAEHVGYQMRQKIEQQLGMPLPPEDEKLPPQIEIALMREYDALPTWDNDMRFRVYKNKPYQFTEYRKERYRELIETQSEY